MKKILWTFLMALAMVAAFAVGWYCGDKYDLQDLVPQELEEFINPSNQNIESEPI